MSKSEKLINEMDIDEYFTYTERLKGSQRYNTADEYAADFQKLVDSKMVVRQIHERYAPVHLAYLREMFNRDMNTKGFPEPLLKFITSKNLSDFFKSSIKSVIDLNNANVLKVLDGNTDFNDMNAGQISIIKEAIDNYKDDHIYNIDSNDDMLIHQFDRYLTKLTGKGVKTYIINHTDSYTLIADVLNRSGMSSRAAYYSGDGVTTSDLNSDNLVAIFKKLYEFDYLWAANFIQMVNAMQTLGATEFIESLYALGRNGFVFSEKNLKSSNVSFEGAYGKDRDMIAFISAFETLHNRKSPWEQERLTLSIKRDFMNKLMDLRDSLEKNVTLTDTIENYYNALKPKNYY